MHIVPSEYPRADRGVGKHSGRERERETTMVSAGLAAPIHVLLHSTLRIALGCRPFSSEKQSERLQRGPGYESVQAVSGEQW
jgi:hypothetical protein